MFGMKAIFQIKYGLDKDAQQFDLSNYDLSQALPPI